MLLEQAPNDQLLQAASLYGTPLYVYDTNRIGKQYHKLADAFSGYDTRIFYACKALTNINILKYLYQLGANVDCSSVNEVKLAIHAGFEKDRIVYTSNGIAFSEIEEVASYGVYINIDSISNLKKFAQKFGDTYPVGIRIRPNIMGGGNIKISTGHDMSKFGIPIEQMNLVMDIVKEYNLKVNVLHLHTGSDIKDVEVFVKGVEVLYDLIPHFPHLTCIDLGSGFKVPYRNGDKETDVVHLAELLKDVFNNHPNAATGQQFQLWFEPGKFLVSQCGYLVTQVAVIKDTPKVSFVGVDTGFNHLIRPMFYDSYHYIDNLSNTEGEKKLYTVVGNICETDTFATDRKLPEVTEGDYLVFYNAGAYGFEMSSNFNSRFKPAEVMLHNNEVKLIRRRDDFEDLIRNQVNAI